MWHRNAQIGTEHVNNRLTQLPLPGFPPPPWWLAPLKDVSQGFPWQVVPGDFLLYVEKLHYARRCFYVRGYDAPGDPVRGARAFYFAHLFLRENGETFMPTSTNKGRTASLRWVNLRLTDEDKDAILDNPPNAEAVLNKFASMAYQGYRLSVSYDDYSKALQASLVCASGDSENVGFGISSRHPDLDMALISLLYKITLIGDTPWSEYASPPTRSDWS